MDDFSPKVVSIFQSTGKQLEIKVLEKSFEEITLK